MDTFIAVVCGEMKEPKYWNDLFNEYNLLINGNKPNHIFSLIKEIAYIENKCFAVQVLCLSIYRDYDTEMAKELNVLYPRFRYDNTETVKKEIETTLSLTKSELLKLSEKKALLKSKISENKLTRSDWDLSFIQISKFLTFKVDAKTMTVSEYVTTLKLLKESNKITENGKSRIN